MIDTWVQTVSGEKVNPFNPDPDTIKIEDLAHHLSNICRFTGAVSRFYSVAEHCCLVSKIVSPKNAMIGLLHDASEAYLNDIARPVKPYLTNYHTIESELQTVIFKKFNLPIVVPEEVTIADDRLCFTEGVQLMPDTSCWELQEEPYDFSIQGWYPPMAKMFFLDRFKELS